MVHDIMELLVGLHFARNTPKSTNGKNSIRYIKTMAGAPGTAYYDYIYTKVAKKFFSGNRRKEVRDRDPTLKPVFASCSGCIPASVATHNN